MIVVIRVGYMKVVYVRQNTSYNFMINSEQFMSHG